MNSLFCDFCPANKNRAFSNTEGLRRHKLFIHSLFACSHCNTLYLNKTLVSTATSKHFGQRLRERFLISHECLVANGYPTPSTVQTKDYKVDEVKCQRCGEPFSLNADKSIPKGLCVYHCKRTRTSGERKIYICCDGDISAPGCSLADSHVHQLNEGDWSDFVKTRKLEHAADVYAVDCEMVYTQAGLELARVTLVDQDLNTALDTFVKPTTPVVDYNTQFSGIVAKDLEGENVLTMEQLHKLLLQMISADTVLIGHSLQHDLEALKLFHDNVVDTSLVFFHHHGLPNKRPLKHLALDILKKKIQDNDACGHDSSEDARCCMQLMIYRVNLADKCPCSSSAFSNQTAKEKMNITTSFTCTICYKSFPAQFILFEHQRAFHGNGVFNLNSLTTYLS